MTTRSRTPPPAAAAIATTGVDEPDAVLTGGVEGDPVEPPPVVVDAAQ